MSSRMGKTARQQRVSQILEDHQVTNQSQLVELLGDSGVVVNQATVSRDLDELGAIKVRVPGGETAYAIPELSFDRVSTDDHLRRVLSDWVAGIDRSGDLVVLRTPPGCAHVVASAIDRSGRAEIIGTVAGDDTLLVVASQGTGPRLATLLGDLAGLDI